MFCQDIAEANFRTSSSRLLAAVMSALCNTSVKLTSILPIAYDGEVLLRSLVKQVSTENDSALAHRFPLLVAHMEKLSHVSYIIHRPGPRMVPIGNPRANSNVIKTASVLFF